MAPVCPSLYAPRLCTVFCSGREISGHFQDTKMSSAISGRRDSPILSKLPSQLIPTLAIPQYQVTLTLRPSATRDTDSADGRQGRIRSTHLLHGNSNIFWYLSVDHAVPMQSLSTAWFQPLWKRPSLHNYLSARQPP